MPRFIRTLLPFITWIIPVALLLTIFHHLFQANYPIDTSWLPADIGIAKFIQQWGWHQGWYPYWYLGLPFHWSTGPVIPGLLLVTRSFFDTIQNLSPEISWYRSGLFLQGIALTLAGLGSYFLGKQLFKSTTSAIISSFIYSFFPSFIWVFPQTWSLPWGRGVPWHVLSNLAVGNLETTFSTALFPWILWITFILFPSNTSKLYLKKPSARALIILIITLTLLLVQPARLISWLISVAIYFAITKQVSRSWLIFTWGVILGWSSSLFWYPISFWFHLAISPSLGGQPLWQMVLFLLQYVGTAFLFAIVITKNSRLAKLPWTIKWLLVSLLMFLTLTLVRFLKDPDFWLDYTGWANELELFSSLFIAWLITKLNQSIYYKGILFAIITITIIQCWRIVTLSDKWVNQEISDFNQKINNWTKESIPVGSTTFISGTPVSWQASLSNFAQVRGARDPAATHPHWAMATYQIRQGESSILAYQWLTALGASYVIVHDQTSSEFWHDFDFPDKFETHQFTLIDKNSGNYLYQVNNSSLARVATEQTPLAPSPQDGSDLDNIQKYTQTLGSPLSFNWNNPHQITIDTQNKQFISLAITFDRLWYISSTNTVDIQKDPLGNIFISNPHQLPSITLTRRPQPLLSWWWIAISSISCLFAPRITQGFSLHLRRLSLGSEEDEHEHY